MLSAKESLDSLRFQQKKALFVLTPKVRFFCLTFWVQYIFQLSYFLISHNCFTCPGSSNSFFSITYATFASLLNKNIYLLCYKSFLTAKIPFICNLLPTFLFYFSDRKDYNKYFRSFMSFLSKLGGTVSLSYYIYHLLGLGLSARYWSTCFRHFYRNDSPSLSHFL